MKKVLGSGRVKIQEIDIVVDMLADRKSLPIKYRDHALGGEYLGYRECHIKPNLLLIYRVEKTVLILILKDIGSHSEVL